MRLFRYCNVLDYLAFLFVLNFLLFCLGYCGEYWYLRGDIKQNLVSRCEYIFDKSVERVVPNKIGIATFLTTPNTTWMPASPILASSKTLPTCTAPGAHYVTITNRV